MIGQKAIDAVLKSDSYVVSRVGDNTLEVQLPQYTNDGDYVGHIVARLVSFASLIFGGASTHKTDGYWYSSNNEIVLDVMTTVQVSFTDAQLDFVPVLLAAIMLANTQQLCQDCIFVKINGKAYLVA